MAGIQETDACILREFINNVEHLRGKRKTAQWQEEMKKIGQPYVKRLENKGYTFREAVGMIAAVLVDQ